MAVVVIAGPIASGKSTLGRAVASAIEETRGLSASVIDLDLVYEMLDPRRRPKQSDRLWTQARRVAGRLATILLPETTYVVAEGNFGTAGELAEFEHELPAGTETLLVMLEVSLETAYERASADDSRGVSRRRAFLSEHYRTFEHGWGDRDALHLHTGRTPLADCARLVVDSLSLVS